MNTFWIILTIILATVSFAALNRGRGAGAIPRIVFAIAGGYVLSQGDCLPALLLGAAIFIGWLWGHGRYAGAITHTGAEIQAFDVLAEKEDPVTDFIMRPLEKRLKLRTWGTIAMSVRYFIWLLPFYYIALGDDFYIPALFALGAGPCYLLANLYGDWLWERKEETVDEWALAEWIFAGWFAASVLVYQNFNLIIGA